MQLKRRGNHYVTRTINDIGDFYTVHLRMNDGVEEWNVTLRADSGIELEHIALCNSYDSAERTVHGLGGGYEDR